MSDGFRHSKALGQNFISDTNLLRAIVADAGITACDAVVEVGAGAGALTEQLAACADRVVAYEIDTRLEQALSRCQQAHPNVQVVFGDILEQPIASVVSRVGAKYKLVANLPYYITTPILFYFLESDCPPESMTVMVQREVGERMAATSGKEFGALSVGLQAYYDVRLGRAVPRTMFSPPPNVDSVLVHMTKSDRYAIADRAAFRRLVRAAFGMRRKTLVNNLIAAYSISRAAAEQLLARAGLPLTARAEQVSVEQFVRLLSIFAE